MPVDSRPILRLGHSPDPDDAFMWWPLIDPVVGQSLGHSRFRFEPVLHDIQTLNQMAVQGELEITALSCAAWPGVRNRYVLTACGASMGDGFGPKIVSKQRLSVDDLRESDIVVGVPGLQTSAFAAAGLLIGAGRFRFEVMPFDQILDAVAADRIPTGIIIHEGQLTYEDRGLHLVADLGAWWTGRTGLPLPLGVNAIRRDLDDLHGPGTISEVAGTLQRSVRAALANRDRALDYAMGFSSTTSKAVADRFVEMYVNRWTLDFGPMGHEAVRAFVGSASRAGLLDDPGQVDFVTGDEPATMEPRLVC